MDISFLNEYMIPVIIGLCLCAGFVVKHWVNDVDNRIIPTMCALFGIGLSLYLNNTFTAHLPSSEISCSKTILRLPIGSIASPSRFSPKPRCSFK